ncbi:MAG: DEAD/DEAH box helicase [Tissierellia bacterium]|nr:DEAD/DEAH box helicase [Tissierellia bacterium]
MGLDPVKTSKSIFNRFTGYVTTTLKIDDENLNNQINNILIEPGKFSKGPIIEATPPFKSGKSILNLINDGVLSEEFRTFNSNVLPLSRSLYKHQEEAIVKIVRDKRNVVVATGTGSGKTEAFIIPIINQLLEEKGNNILTPGVRALLLYPMNALANDQMKRLRELLINEPEITFGIYTGETEERYNKAYDKFKRMHQEEPMMNELISREQMKKSPPHILLTNYAMLEYLMLRPDDNVFFQGEFSNDWKYIVIDEAHTYTGAKGIEMSMLISRLKSTIGLKRGDLTCIMTSASLGNGTEDYPQVAEFGMKLFGEEFISSDVVGASKETLKKVGSWGSPDPKIYSKISEYLSDDSDSDIVQLMKDCHVPIEIIDREFNNDCEIKIKLYNIFREDERINNAIEILAKGPIQLDELAKNIFNNDSNNLSYVAALIDLCNILRKSKADNPLIPARYHFIIKALEGAFIIFTEKPKIYLDRMNNVTVDDEEYKAFEIASCTKCHSLYIVGETVFDENDGYSYLVESNNKYYDDKNELEFYSFLKYRDDNYTDDENEDDIFESVDLKNEGFSTYKLCIHCGGINEDCGREPCNCSNPKYVRVLKNNSKDGKASKCSICGGVNTKGGILRRFFLSEDAVSSVLATALYGEIPNNVKKNDTQKINKPEGLFDFLEEETEEVKKQLLIFSDSRQNAAYFAPYLNNSYRDILIKNIMIDTIKKNKDECINNKWTLNDYCNRIIQFINQNNLSLEYSIEELNKEVWKWIMREFIGSRGSNSLENLGFMMFVPNFDSLRNKLLKIPLFKKLKFSEEETMEFYRFLLDQFRLNRAIEYPENIKPIDEYFSPINQQGGILRISPDGEKKGVKGYSIKSWVPKNDSYSNTRIDYLSKILNAKGIRKTRGEIINILKNIFDLFADVRSPLYSYIKTENINLYGKIFKVDPKIYKVVPGIWDNHNYYQCNSCFKISSININNICPSYRCNGELEEIDLNKLAKDNHYRKIYQNSKLEKMKVSEHTAQLTTEYAAEIQNRFINGDVNVLSCSTTFELGVDVGRLETVFMKNIPPTPANYAQRAGRAGRRLDSTAYALSYARLASHDFNSFSNPYKMISGVVKPPYFEVANAKIARRHLYACALAGFWRIYIDYFKNVECFFRNEDVNGPELFYEYLSTKPELLLNMIREVVPKTLHYELGVEEWGWVEDLYGKNGDMTKVVDELENDLNNLENAKQQAIQDENFWRAGDIKKVINTILKRSLINFISQKNILPKYGFPVDVVNLEVNTHIDEALNIDLSRDLQIAISEYAPGSQVVANGKLWTSRYVKKVRNKELLRYKYSSCSCGYFNKVIDTETEIDKICPVCGNHRLKKGKFIMPEFGFITDGNVELPGSARPEKTYSSRKHFSGVGNKVEEKEIRIGSNIIKLTSQNHGELSVINNGKGQDFYICKTCGYGNADGIPKKHNNTYDKECKGRVDKLALGYNFETDIVEIDFGNIFIDLSNEDGFWESLMYSIIEGMSIALEIDRSDIDGTLYVKNNLSKSLILFDTVPGGAGHVKRLMDKECFKLSLEKALEVVSECSCGGEKQDTSCYNCLRNYYNQYCHDKMKRCYAIDGLHLLLEPEEALSNS